MKNGSYAGRRSIRTGPVGAGTARPVREAAVVPPMRCAAPFPWLCCPDVSLRGAKRRGNLGKALPICTNRRSIRTGPVGAGHAPPVREAAVVPPIRCAAPFPLLRCPDVSLRGPKGAVAISGRQFRFRRWLSCDPAMTCEIAPQGHFLALRAQGATSAFGLLAMTNLGALRH